MFSAAKAFHAYGLGNSLTFPMSVGAAAVLLPDRPTPDAVLAVMQRAQPDDLRRRADAVRLAAGASAHRAQGRIGPPAPLHLRRRGAARGGRPALVRHGRRAHPGRHRLDRDAAYLRLATAPDDVRYGTVGQAGARLRGARRGRAWPPGAARRGGRTGGARPVGGRRLLEPARQDPPHLPRRMDPHRRHLHPRRRGLLPLSAAAATRC